MELLGLLGRMSSQPQLIKGVYPTQHTIFGNPLDDYLTSQLTYEQKLHLTSDESEMSKGDYSSTSSYSMPLQYFAGQASTSRQDPEVDPPVITSLFYV